MSKDTCIKANTYCPVHKGIVGADCWHDSKDFSVPRTDWKQVDETTALREQVKKLKAELTSIDGALNDPRANLTLTTSEIIWELKEQVKKLENRLNKDSQEFTILCAKETEKVLREQLAALAEQNAKMREALVDCEQALDECRDYPITYDSVIEALSLPNLATPVLNKLKAEAYREAADIVENIDVYTFVHGGSSYDDGGLTLSLAATAILAKADELEKGEPS